MIPYRTIAIPTELASRVRSTLRAPHYGHPVHVEVATGYGPCRHCLRPFAVGRDRRLLFTYDPFAGLEPFPVPGPVFIHEQECPRYPEHAGFPGGIDEDGLTIIAYARGRDVRDRVHARDEVEVSDAIQRLLAGDAIDYLHVRNTAAGCYDLRIERG